MKNKPSISQECHPVSTMPTEDEDDEQAILEAAQHREHASTIVRNHLENHAANNPDASSDYVTWIATLHPENADITIDQRFFVPGNPWWTIYEDTKNSQIPLATAVPVKSDDTERESTINVEDEESGHTNQDSSDEEGQDSQKGDDKTKDRQCCLTCNPFAIFFGFVVAIPALVFVITCEIVSLFTCYLPGAICYHIAKFFSPPDCCTCILYLVFITVHGVLSFGDSMVLVMSIFGTELVGLVAIFVGFLSGGCLWAEYLHQQIRRLSHGIRVVFRKKTTCDKPPRRFFCNRTAEEDSKSHLKGVKVIRVERVRRPGESYH